MNQPPAKGPFVRPGSPCSFGRTLLLGAVLSLAACGTPIPEEKADYVGEWQAPNMYLRIDADGSAEYIRQEGATRTSITGPVKGFDGDDFEVGLWILAKTFEVSTPPYQEEDTWKMVVDGVELTRTTQAGY